MQIDLGSLPAGQEWKPVKTSVGEFEVLVRRASFMERMRNLALRTQTGPEVDDITAEVDGHEYRLKTAIVDWRGLQGPDGGPIPFCWATLSATCGAYPEIFNELSTLANRAFYRAAEPADAPAPAPGSGDVKGDPSGN